MNSAQPDPPPASPLQPALLTARELAGGDRMAALRELYGRQLMRVDLRPDAGWNDQPDFHASVTDLGGGAAFAHVVHTPFNLWRSPELMQDGADDIYVASHTAGHVVHGPSGEFAVQPGGLSVLSKARQHLAITPRSGTSVGLQLSRARLARIAPQLEEAPMRPLTADTPGAALALAYSALLIRDRTLAPSQLQHAVDHLYHLVAGALVPAALADYGPDCDAVTAPRLALIKRDILARLDRPGLDLATIARLHHLTPRHVQRLFAREGSSFSDFLWNARLERARSMLADPLLRQRRILQIALDNGFTDITAFNRAFRRRYGITPSEAR